MKKLQRWYASHMQRKSSWCKLLLPAISMLQDLLRHLQIQKEHERLYSAIPYLDIILLCSLLWTQCYVAYTVSTSATLHRQISSTALLRSESGAQPRVTKSSLDSQGSWRTEDIKRSKKYFEIVCSTLQCLVIHQ